MKTLLLTNEYPPYIYGGAGVHVDYISQALSSLCDVEIRCFGDQNIHSKHLKVKGYPPITSNYSVPKPLHRVFDAIDRCIRFCDDNIDANLVHVHTWYTHFAGILAKINYSIPLVVTVHSLEPLRPWKKEQLGEGYNFSTWVEKTALETADAVIAVSQQTKQNILELFRVREDKIHVIPNGIDPEEYKPVKESESIEKLGVNPDKPYILFVGRITRQKGIIHLVNAIQHMDRNFQIVLCATAPDTKEIKEEMESHIKEAQKTHPQIIWIKQMVDKPSLIALYSHASVFCCPSLYEPFGIINIEAMACETPVVATSTGGIKEAVEDGRTGFLVPVKMKGHSPADPEQFSLDLATKINTLMKDEKLREVFGKAGRKRVIENFTWRSVAEKTFSIYKGIAT